MAKSKQSNDKRPDFLRDQSSDKTEKITGKDIWLALTLRHDPTRKVFGFTLIALSLIMGISFISFFFSWNMDQSLMATDDWDSFNQSGSRVKNSMGYFGAWLSYKFIHNGFGIGSFAFLPYVALCGMFLLLDYRPFSLLRILIHSMLVAVWISLFMGLFLGMFPLLGGAVGFFSNQLMIDSIGWVGAFLVLVGYGVAYSIFFLNLNPFARIKLKQYPMDGSDYDADFHADGSGNIQEEVLADENREEEAISESVEAEIIEDDDDDTLLTPEQIEQLTQISIKKVDVEEQIVIDPSSEEDTMGGKKPTFTVTGPLFVPEIEENALLKESEANSSQSDLRESQGSVVDLSIEVENPKTMEEVVENYPPISAVIEDDSGFKIEDLTAAEEEMVEENIGDLALENGMERRGLDTVYDPTADLSAYKFPTLDLMTEYDAKKQEIDMVEIQASKDMIIQTLENYKIGISSIKASVGPTVTLYEIVPAPGVKISKIKNLEDDIALSLAALGIRIIAPIPGKGTIGIEVPNKNPEMVPMRSVLASKKFQDCDFQLPVVLGKTISNEIFITDLAKMPHLLMAGATGQGKSVGLNAILVSLLYKKHPAYVKFVLVDPKKVELTLFNKIERHFLAKLPGDGEAIITDNHKVINTLNSLCVEMDNRYKLLQDALVRNIIEYNAKFLARKLNPNEGHRFLPYIVVVIDEVADLMMTAGKEIETPIARLAQLARAIGIHLILATQRPSVNVITGMIKANFPARIAFRVTSKIDSRTILDANGADQLIGKGDMLYSGGNEMIRLQCPFVDTPEVERIVDFIGEQRAFPLAYQLPEVKEEGGVLGGEGFDPNERDDMFEDAARIVVLNQVGSTSMIQRKLKIGYNRAGRLMDQLEDAGIVGPNNGSKARQVLLPDEYSLEQFLRNLND
ncbi:MAG: DNA translocase FtsK 4TM domain-containing protein [Bacteroidota bacterium]